MWTAIDVGSLGASETASVENRGRSEALEPSELNHFNSVRTLTVIAEHLCHRLPTQVVATLGPAGTSSEQAARYLIRNLPPTLAQHMDISLFESFEAAAAAVVNGSASLLLVANAYSCINHFYMHSKLSVLDTFIHVTPEYGVAARNDLTSKTNLRLTTHPAVTPLIDEFVPEGYHVAEVILAKSTSDAAHRVAAGELELALTNASSVKKHGLRFLSHTRPIRMVWTIFGRNPSAPLFDSGSVRLHPHR